MKIGSMSSEDQQNWPTTQKLEQMDEITGKLKDCCNKKNKVEKDDFHVELEVQRQPRCNT